MTMRCDPNAREAAKPNRLLRSSCDDDGTTVGVSQSENGGCTRRRTGKLCMVFAMLCIGCADHGACWLCKILTKHFPFQLKRIPVAIPDSCFRWQKTGASRIQLSVSTNTPGMRKRYANTAHFIEATALQRGSRRSVRPILGVRCQASSSQNRMSLMGALPPSWFSAGRRNSPPEAASQTGVAADRFWPSWDSSCCSSVSWAGSTKT